MGKTTKPRKKFKDAEETEEKISYFKLYRYASTLDKILICVGIICAVGCGVMQPFVMILFGDTTGAIIAYVEGYSDELSAEEYQALEDALFQEIYRFVNLSCLLGSLMIVALYLAGVCFSYTALKQVFHIRKLILQRTLNLDISWFDLNKSGDFATVFTENLAKFEEGIGDKVVSFVFFQSIFISGIIMALVLGWKLALVCLTSLPFSTLTVALIGWLSTKFSQQELQAYGAAGSIAEEVLSSIRTVVAFGGQNTEYQRYQKHLLSAQRNNIRKSFFTSISNGLMWFFVFASYALSFYYGVSLILEERYLPESERVYTPANMVSVFFCTLIAGWNFGQGAPYFDIFGAASGAASKIFKILDTQPFINLSKTGGKQTGAMTGGIKFENVRFRYPTRPEVQILKGLNLEIRAGETVALVGSSGCGKSTIVQLIQRFYDTNSGIVRIDDTNVETLNLNWLRSQIGVVGQEPALFAATIAENIRYGDMSAQQEDIERAARKANAHNFIKSLPRGYETLIGERGAQLSGGQKQRIAIARALIRTPKILLLDEATSALDTTSEAEVQAALDAVSGECTTVIVAHRLSTIRNANRIVVLDQGTVVEEGNHTALMERKGLYYNLVISQGLAETEDLKPEKEMRLLQRVTSVERPEAEPFEEDVVVEEQNTGNTLLQVLKMNRKEWLYIVIGCISAVISGAALPIYGLVFGDIIGVLADPDDDYVRSQSNLFSLYFIIIGVVIGVATLMQMHSFSIAGEKLTLKVRATMFRTVLNQEMAWFDKKENGVGALCAKLAGEAASVQGASGVRIGTVLNSISTFLLAAGIAFYHHWKLTLVNLSLAPIILISVVFEQRFTQGDNQINQNHLENSAKIAVESISNIRTIASLGCENVFYENYVRGLEPYVKNMTKQMHFRSLVIGIARSIMFYAYALGFWYGARLIIDEGVDYGTVFVVSETVIIGSWSIGNAFAFSPNFQQGLSAANRIFALLKRVPAVHNVEKPHSLDIVSGEVQYENVHFSYPNRASVPVLKGLDLTIFQGKTVALVGSSGCGKSTIIQLLERFYDPTSGSVSLDKNHIQGLDLDNLRSHLGIVSQEPNLFDRTIGENIAYGAQHRSVSKDEIIEAAKSANIHNFITSLPLGYETSLGSKGAQLSGGQKQRVAIARALIRNPRILLLDEATSALDNESEKIVQEALDNAKKDRTCITIAHRLTTIQDADLICVLSEGLIVEMGKHAELLEKQGLYYKFYKLQAGQG